MNERGLQNLQLSQNPNVRKFLDMIQKAEGAKGYAYGFGNKPLASLEDHPRDRSGFTETSGKKNTTDAAGAYQFMSKTWDGLKGKIGAKDFGPDAQEAGAVELLRGRGALDAILKGDWKTALDKTGKEWASLPTSPYPQKKRSEDFVYQALGVEKPGPLAGPQFLNKIKEMTEQPKAMPVAPVATPEDPSVPMQIAEAPPVRDTSWRDQIMKDAILADASDLKQTQLGELFADASLPAQEHSFDLPVAVSRELSGIIRAL